MKILRLIAFGLLALPLQAAIHNNGFTTNAPGATINASGSGVTNIGTAQGTNLNFKRTVYSGLFYVTNFAAGVAGITNDTTEYTIASCTIPGGTIGSNGVFQVTTLTAGYGGATNATWRMKWGNTVVQGWTIGAAFASIEHSRRVRNVNSQANQVSFPATSGTWGTSSIQVETDTFDTSTNFTASLTYQNSGTGQTNQVLSVMFEILGHE